MPMEASRILKHVTSLDLNQLSELAKDSEKMASALCVDNPLIVELTKTWVEVRKMRLAQDAALIKKIDDVKKEVAKFHHMRDKEAKEVEKKTQNEYEDWEDIAEQEVVGEADEGELVEEVK